MEWISFLAIWLLLAYWTYSIAKKNGRDPILGGLIGFATGLIGVIIYYIIGKSKDLKDKELSEKIKSLQENK